MVNNKKGPKLEENCNITKRIFMKTVRKIRSNDREYVSKKLNEDAHSKYEG